MGAGQQVNPLMYGGDSEDLWLYQPLPANAHVNPMMIGDEDYWKFQQMQNGNLNPMLMGDAEDYWKYQAFANPPAPARAQWNFPTNANLNSDYRWGYASYPVANPLETLSKAEMEDHLASILTN